jgi:hypothetical protein
LAGNEQIDLFPMILVVSEAGINLSPRKVWKTVQEQRIDRFAILKEANNIMNADPRSLDYR